MKKVLDNTCKKEASYTIFNKGRKERVEQKEKEREYEQQREREVVMIPALRDLAHPLAYWLIWSTASKLAEV